MKREKKEIKKEEPKAPLFVCIGFAQLWYWPGSSTTKSLMAKEEQGWM